MRPALVIVDMQHGFVQSLPTTRRHLDLMSHAIKNLVLHFDGHERPVIHVITVHQPDGSTWDRVMRKRGQGRLLAGSAEAEMAEGLAVQANHKCLTKTRKSAFVGTGLESFLHNAGIDTIVLAGSQAHVGVCRTAIDADERDFGVILVADGIGDDGSGRADIVLQVLCRDYAMELRPHGEIMALLDPPLDPKETVRALNRSIERLEKLERPSAWPSRKD
jgi:nicotinamidase-related amidase